MVRDLLTSMMNGHYGPDRIGKDGKTSYLLTATKAELCLAKALITNVNTNFLQVI